MRPEELTHGWVRLARAGVLGGASLFLATAGHVVGGGTLPGAGLLALTGVALALVAVSLTGRRLRLVPLLALLSLEQLALHLLLHAATAATTCASVAMPGHAMVPAAICGVPTAGTTGTSGWPMVAGHLLAVLATAWLLARGERWLWQTVERVHAYASARPAVRRRRPAPASPALLVRQPVGAAWSSAAPRGPPVLI